MSPWSVAKIGLAVFGVCFLLIFFWFCFLLCVVRVQSQLGETEEEFISNKLITLLQNCKAEKERLALQIEQEEEYLTNTLQKKLDQLKREKVDIENQMEQEQEYIVNRLQIQLDETRKEKE
uniref:Uncharacterized protein n=1 Tax=Rhodosorus marinus TaxID=101924 RepID=A0A7S2ZYA2_9RHOD|mmetsp:Transcript_37425/g.149319  ORF Transcript_37425/g.149319 Transcript_37425/m.149319 type:complete len:121 (+) Transcript_37425:764-1126(+)